MEFMVGAGLVCDMQFSNNDNNTGENKSSKFKLYVLHLGVSKV